MIEEEIEKDLIIDKTDLAHESATNPIKHFKYLRMLKEKKKQLKIIESKMKQTKASRYLFYIGKHPLKNCNTEFEKSQIKPVLEGDTELIKAENEVYKIKNEVEMLEEVLRIFVNRGFAIRNIIDIRKMENGIN